MEGIEQQAGSAEDHELSEYWANILESVRLTLSEQLRISKESFDELMDLTSRWVNEINATNGQLTSENKKEIAVKYIAELGRTGGQDSLENPVYAARMYLLNIISQS